ncbi:hypothetical protein CGZ93_05655 [Enemella dayhoffiae]|uniref:Uncharacterized protein n=1 Tax=Enemella dayhoffiae TaxID=2016507 RepID=A0A255H8D6_9ACTN|nr:hypothetical protein [Enemella dayhoffiae]OYO23988.1 hypothetical protein CGZ93_05655 [Enemella dayhoffiae]
MSNDGTEYRPRRAALPSDEESAPAESPSEKPASARRGWTDDAQSTPADEPASADAGKHPGPGFTRDPGTRTTPEQSATDATRAAAKPGAEETRPRADEKRPGLVARNWPAAPSRSAEQPAAQQADQPAERPANPFAPTEPAKKRPNPLDRVRRRSKEEPEQTPVGRRAAEPSKRGFDKRNTMALSVAAISALCIIAVLVSYALWSLNRRTEQTGPVGQGVSATPGPVLAQSSLLTDGQAKSIDPSRTWSQSLTEQGVNDSSPGAACIGPQPTGQPGPAITLLRQLKASGDDKTAALHRADAYASPEEAAQMFNFRSTEIGGCVGSPLYVEKGFQITGVGNQAVGVRLVLQDRVNEYHSIVLVRTGRVLNILDVVRMGQPADIDSMVKALSQAVNRQCGPAVGLCTAPSTSVNLTIPPPGGDQPGFLASGDIPRVTQGVGQWRGNAPGSRVTIQDGTNCEAIDFATVSGASTRQQRTYLLRNDPAAPPEFGIDEIMLQMENPKSANELVDKISNNIKGCEQRTLTAKVQKQAPLLTPAQGTEVKGAWYVVTQKLDQTRTQKYRVGIFSAGQKVIYLRANPSDTFDFSDEAWIGVNLRAGERSTQIR